MTARELAREIAENAQYSRGYMGMSFVQSCVSRVPDDGTILDAINAVQAEIAVREPCGCA